MNNGTRRERAQRLLQLLQRGPSLMEPRQFGLPALTPEEVTRLYRMWAESWILEDLVDLIPELRLGGTK